MFSVVSLIITHFGMENSSQKSNLAPYKSKLNLLLHRISLVSSVILIPS